MSLDDDPTESILGGSLLGFCDGGLQGRRGGVTVLVLGQYETEGDELVGIIELHEVLPVLFVEASHGRKDEHMFAVRGRIAGDGDLVEVEALHVASNVLHGRLGRGLGWAMLVNVGMRTRARGGEEVDDEDAEDGADEQSQVIRPPHSNRPQGARHDVSCAALAHSASCKKTEIRSGAGAALEKGRFGSFTIECRPLGNKGVHSSGNWYSL